MRVQLMDPLEGVRVTGGATFEPHVGWWTQADAPGLGRVLEEDRDAIYIPTLQKNGSPVPPATLEEIKRLATTQGLSTLTRAVGMWVLSTTGQVQTETIWIAHGRAPSLAALRRLAETINQAAHQDCAAYELAGELHFVASTEVIYE